MIDEVLDSWYEEENENSAQRNKYGARIEKQNGLVLLLSWWHTAPCYQLLGRTGGVERQPS